MALLRPIGLHSTWSVLVLLPAIVVLDSWATSNLVCGGKAGLHPAAYFNSMLAAHAQCGRRDLAAAEHFEKEALTCYEGNQKNDAFYASISRNLGLVLEKEGKYDEAVSRLEDALAVQRKLYSDKSTWVAATLVDLGRVHRLHGVNNDLEKSERCLNEALETYQALTGPNSRETRNTIVELAILDNECLHFTEAYHRLQGLIASSGSLNTPSLHENRVRLALINMILDDKVSARETARLEVAEFRRDKFLRRHAKWTYMLNLAVLCRNVGFYDDAEYLFERADRRATRYGATTPAALQVKQRWAEKYYLEAKYDKAEKMVKEILPYRTECTEDRIESLQLLERICYATGQKELGQELNRIVCQNFQLAGEGDQKQYQATGILAGRHCFHRVPDSCTLY